MHADRTNRTVFILLALLLLAAGTGVILLSTGVFGAAMADTSVSDNVVTRFVADNHAWVWPVAAVVALLVFVLAVRWLLTVLFSTDRAGDYQVPGDRAHGATTLAAGALTSAVEEEIETYRGVHAAGARLIGDPTAPHLVIDVTVHHDADLGATRRRVEQDAVAHTRAALDQPNMPATVNLSITSRSLNRVR